MRRKLTDVASSLAAQNLPRAVVYIVDFENIPKTDVAALLDEPGVRMVVLAANSTNTVTPNTLRTIEMNPERVEVIIGRITRKEFVDKLVTAKIGEYAFRFPDAEIIVLANDKDYSDLADHLNDHWEREVPIRHVAPDKVGRRTAAKSGAAKSGAAKSGAAKSGAAKSGATKSGATKSGATKSGAAKSGAPRKRGAQTKQSSPSDARTPPAAVTPARPAKGAKTQKNQGISAKSPTKQQQQPPRGEKPASSTATNPDADVILTLLRKMPSARRPKTAASLLNAVRNYREAMGLRARPTTILRHLQERRLVLVARDGDGDVVTYALVDDA